MSKMLEVRDMPDDVFAETKVSEHRRRPQGAEARSEPGVDQQAHRAAAMGISLSEFALQQLSLVARQPMPAESKDMALLRQRSSITFAEAREAVVGSRPPD